MLEVYEQLLEALKGTGIPFAEYAWVDASQMPGDWGVIAPDGAGRDLLADGIHLSPVGSGSIDLFTHDQGRAQAATVQMALDSFHEVAWRLNSVQYEPDTHLMHYEWLFEIAG